jgi:hypothetical protein
MAYIDNRKNIRQFSKTERSLPQEGSEVSLLDINLDGDMKW